MIIQKDKQFFAVKIMQALKTWQDMSGGCAEDKNPIALAGAALYISCVFNGEKHTQKQIADVAGMNTVTLRMRSEPISKNFDIETLLKKGKKA